MEDPRAPETRSVVYKSSRMERCGWAMNDCWHLRILPWLREIVLVDAPTSPIAWLEMHDSPRGVVKVYVRSTAENLESMHPHKSCKRSPVSTHRTKRSVNQTNHKRLKKTSNSDSSPQPYPSTDRRPPHPQPCNALSNVAQGRLSPASRLTEQLQRANNTNHTRSTHNTPHRGSTLGMHFEGR